MSTTQDEYDDVAGLEAGLAAGFDEYVSKPIIDERVLLRAIERCLARAP